MGDRLRQADRIGPGPDVKAIAMVSDVDIARQFRLGTDGTQDPAVFQAMLDAAAAARTAEARGEDVQSLQLFPDTAEQAQASAAVTAWMAINLYDKPEYVDPAVAKLTDSYATNLIKAG